MHAAHVPPSIRQWNSVNGVSFVRSNVNVAVVSGTSPDGPEVIVARAPTCADAGVAVAVSPMTIRSAPTRAACPAPRTFRPYPIRATGRHPEVPHSPRPPLGAPEYAGDVTYVASEARQRLLDTIAEATDELARALAALGAAYEDLDDDGADRLEDQLFRPVQSAYGRAKRCYADFAGAHRLETRELVPATAGPASRHARGFLEDALDAIGEAELILTELQDSMLPVEVGDAELRAALAEIRTLIDGAGSRAEQFMRLLGR